MGGRKNNVLMIVTPLTSKNVHPHIPQQTQTGVHHTANVHVCGRVRAAAREREQ